MLETKTDLWAIDADLWVITTNSIAKEDEKTLTRPSTYREVSQRFRPPIRTR